jgi:hypothetical protein
VIILQSSICKAQNGYKTPMFHTAAGWDFLPKVLIRKGVNPHTAPDLFIPEGRKWSH